MSRKKENAEEIKLLQQRIESQGFVRGSEANIVKDGRVSDEKSWLFDVKTILMQRDVMDAFAKVFWETYGTKGKIQIGTMETAGIPIMSALVATGKYFDREVSGFFIRKSRKKEGLTKMVEGKILPDVPVILVDDIMNSGKNFSRQVEVVESCGGKVVSVWALIRFRDKAYYSYLRDKGIDVDSIFTLDDFTETLDVRNLEEKDAPKPKQITKPLWKFESKDPDYHHVVAKSDPLIDAERVYVGSDNGTMWALNQKDGNVAWSYKVGMRNKHKGIHSSPTIFDGRIYFGAYDGNIYALDIRDGKKLWTYFEADWVGSSPAVAPDLGLIFVGVEFGLWRKRGGIVALDARTGRKVWEYKMPCFTHSSPLYIDSQRQVVIGSNDGAVYLFDAKKGALLWKFQSAEPSEAELDVGYSEYDIKGSFAYDAKRDRIICTNMHGDVLFIDRKNAKELGRFKADFGFYSTPVIYKDTVLVSSLDKYLYCIDLDTLQEKWRWNAGARVFATPLVVGTSLYIGANTGRFTELDAEAGKEKSFLVLTERITNRAAYNPISKRFFVPTFANELYCFDLEK